MFVVHIDRVLAIFRRSDQPRPTAEQARREDDEHADPADE